MFIYFRNEQEINIKCHITVTGNRRHWSLWFPGHHRLEAVQQLAWAQIYKKKNWSTNVQKNGRMNVLKKIQVFYYNHYLLLINVNILILIVTHHFIGWKNYIIFILPECVAYIIGRMMSKMYLFNSLDIIFKWWPINIR